MAIKLERSKWNCSPSEAITEDVVAKMRIYSPDELEVCPMVMPAIMACFSFSILLPCPGSHVNGRGPCKVLRYNKIPLLKSTLPRKAARHVYMKPRWKKFAVPKSKKQKLLLQLFEK